MARPNYRQREAVRARLKAIGAPCAICGKPIDYSLGWWVDPTDGRRKRHPLSMEYDHIKPRSVCDTEGDARGTWSMDNAQAVHRICNQRKGNKTRVPQSKRNAGFLTNDTPVPKERDMPTSRAW